MPSYCKICITFSVSIMCASGSFYDETSDSCLGKRWYNLDCDPSCLNCVDASNTQCGVCANGFELEVPGVPGPCYSVNCDDSCLTCSGPQSNECETCRSPLSPAFSSGSGECILSCSEISA